MEHQQENKHEQSEYLFSPDVTTTKSRSAKHGNGKAVGFWSDKRVGNSNRSCPFLKQTEIQIEIWRRFLFMKKGINKSILFYIASVLFLVASAIGLTTGNENTMAIIWLSLGSAFLCLGSTYKKKENNKTNTDDK